MSAVVFAARVLLGAVLVASGLLKVRDPAWPATARAFSTPAWAVPALPWVELGLGVLVGAQVWAAALAALALLVMFTVVVAVQLARGNRIPCRCFGALSREVVGPTTLVRNGLLCVLAAVALL